MKIAVLMEHERTSTLLSALMKNGIQVEEIKSVPKSLEDVYLNIVRQSEGRA